MSIKQKIMFVSFTIITCIISLIIVILSIIIQSHLVNIFSELTNEVSQKVSSDISNTLKNASQKTYTYKKEYEEGLVSSRSSSTQFLKSLLKEKGIALAVYCGFEPNAFDGQDNAYKFSKDHDSSGRFIPYIYSSGNVIKSEALKNIDDPLQGEFYQKPKRDLRTSITSPYVYKVGGVNMFIVSIMEPILRDGKFIGISGIDISLDSIKDYITSLRFADGQGKITLISDNHLVLYDGLTGISQGLDFRSQEDTEFYIKLKNKDLSLYEFNEHYNVAVSILIFENNDPWFARISIPKSQIQSMLSSIYITTIGLGLIGIFLSITAIYFTFQRLVDKRIQSVSKSTQKIAAGDLRESFDLTVKDELGSLMVSLNQMTEQLRKLIEIAKNSSKKISNTTDKIHITINELTDLAQGQAASSEEASATVEELNASSETIHSNVLSAVENTNTIHESLGQIQILMKTILEKVHHFGEISIRANSKAEEGRSMANLTSKAIREIQEKSKMITQFSNVISDISKRTGLLALNAAIEAARAGESGQGFAVVAEEITKLASQSASSVSQINALSTEALDSIGRGNVQVSQLIEVLQEITDDVSVIFSSSQEIQPMIQDQSQRTELIYTEVEEITGQIRSIQLSTEEQQRATNELAKMTISISDGSQVLSDQSASMAENSEKLTQVSNQLEELLGKFNL
jgi:methyl-accepting chemotaxis protein